MRKKVLLDRLDFYIGNGNETKTRSNKLKAKDIKKYEKNKSLVNFETHPILKLIDGEI